MIYFFAALMVGYLIYEFRIVLPFGMSKTVISYAYFMIGRIGRIIYNQHPRRAVRCQIVALPVCLLIWYITGIRLNGDISLYGMTLGNYWLYFCAALTGTSCFLFLCRIIDRKTTILREWGKNSIFIICSHYFFIEIFKTIAGVAGIEYTWVYDIFGFLFAVGLMFLYQPICRFVDAKIPLISGKYKGTIRIGKEKICIM